MRRFLLLVGCMSALIFIGCTDGSSLPNPTGKGSVRAINAMPTAPSVEFRIGERVLGFTNYKTSTTTALYDDIEYIFNFDVLFSGNILRDRVASLTLEVALDTAYTFLVSGELASPDITVWENDIRVWVPAETLFAVQFGHAAESLGNIDVYFSDPGVAPMLGQQRGTLSFTEALPAIELQTGDYVLTLTVAGDPSMVLFTSDTWTYAPQSTYLLSVFDGDANDTSPWSVHRFGAAGNSTLIPDINYSPTIQFVHASMALATSDIYDELTLTTPIVTDHAFTNVTTDITEPSGDTNVTYTAVDNVGSILFEDINFIPAGLHKRYTMIGADTGSLVAAEYIPDRRSVETLAKFTLMNAASNHLLIDAYLIEGDLNILDFEPRLLGVPFGNLPVSLIVDAGNYDLYVTPAAEKTILVGPIPIDAALGDIFDVQVLDTVDPATAQVLFIPVP